MQFFLRTNGIFGFYDSQLIGIPDGATPIPDDHVSALLIGQGEGKVIAPDADGYPILADPEPSSRSPSRVTMRQARLALHAEGLLQSVEDAISVMPEPSQTAARIEWDHAGHVERSSQFVTMLGAAIGLDDAQMDELFISASIL